MTLTRINITDKVDEEDLLYVVMEKGDTDLASLLKRCAANREITPAMIKHYWAEMLHAVQVILVATWPKSRITMSVYRLSTNVASYIQISSLPIFSLSPAA